MNELSLYSGGAGGLLGSLLLGWTPIGYVEYDKYCQRLIAARIADGILPAAPLFGDVREFLQCGAAREYRGFTDVLTAGFPCQPFSSAGRKEGKRDKRNMWPATIEAIRQVRPRFCFMENVRGLLSSGYFPTILKELAESGYDARWRVLSAAELGAPHKRDRLWIVAHTRSSRRRSPTQLGQYHLGWGDALSRERQQGADGFGDLRADVADADRIGRRPQSRHLGSAGEWSRAESGGSGEDVGDATVEGFQNRGSAQVGRSGQESQFERPSSDMGDTGSAGLSQPQYEWQHGGPVDEPGWWQAEPALDRVVDGYAGRVDELKTIGNAQVPLVAAAAWWLLTEDLDV